MASEQQQQPATTPASRHLSPPAEATTNEVAPFVPGPNDSTSLTMMAGAPRGPSDRGQARANGNTRQTRSTSIVYCKKGPAAGGDNRRWAHAVLSRLQRLASPLIKGWAKPRARLETPAVITLRKASAAVAAVSQPASPPVPTRRMRRGRTTAGRHVDERTLPPRPGAPIKAWYFSCSPAEAIDVLVPPMSKPAEPVVTFLAVQDKDSALANVWTSARVSSAGEQRRVSVVSRHETRASVHEVLWMDQQAPPTPTESATASSWGAQEYQPSEASGRSSDSAIVWGAGSDASSIRNPADWTSLCSDTPSHTSTIVHHPPVRRPSTVRRRSTGHSPDVVDYDSSSDNMGWEDWSWSNEVWRRRAQGRVWGVRGERYQPVTRVGTKLRLPFLRRL